MNVFISWSGSRSHAVAKVLQDWVQAVIQAARPWLSSSDIDRGAMWATEISSQLQTSSIGIFCLTAENKSAPWILFEAGAVAKGVQSGRICTLLIDLEPVDITGPLAMFNHTTISREDMLRLARTLNSALGEARLSEQHLLRAFEAHWDFFQKGVAAALEANPAGKAEPKRTEASLLGEILDLVRTQGHRLARLEQQSPLAWPIGALTASAKGGLLDFPDSEAESKPPSEVDALRAFQDTLLRNKQIKSNGGPDHADIEAQKRLNARRRAAGS